MPRMRVLGDIGEFGLIDRIARILPVAPDAVLQGIGDDCAVLRMGGQTLLVSCDTAVGEVHFSEAFAPPEDIGWKAAAAALSDIAAMGGRARFVLVALACPKDTRVDFVEAIYRGLARAVEQSGAAVVGGDTTQCPSGVMLGLTVIGEPVGGRVLLRSGARCGDALAVTGAPGRSAGGLAALKNDVALPGLIQAHLRPTPRLAEGQWLAERAAVHAMIDLSDGLLQDAAHVAAASGLGVDVDPARAPVPGDLVQSRRILGVDPLELALAGGEDYELIVAIEAASAADLCEEFARRFDLPLTVAGEFTDAFEGVRVGGERPNATGYAHFDE